MAAAILKGVPNLLGGSRQIQRTSESLRVHSLSLEQVHWKQNPASKSVITFV